MLSLHQELIDPVCATSERLVQLLSSRCPVDNGGEHIIYKIDNFTIFILTADMQYAKVATIK